MAVDNNKPVIEGYKLERIAGGDIRRQASADTVSEIKDLHFAALSRTVRDLLRDYQALNITVTEFVSTVSDGLGPVVSFRIVGPPIFDSDSDDSQSLRVDCLRRKLVNTERKNHVNKMV